MRALRLSILLVSWLLTSLAGINALAQEASSAAEPAYDQDADGESRAKKAANGLLGRPAPALTLKTIDGESIDLLSLYGRKPVYFKFWATWCVPCRQQMPGFEDIYQKYGDDIEVIAVNTGFNDSEAAIREYTQKITMSMPIVVDDGTLGSQLNLQVTPMHVLVGRDGRVVYVGHIDGPRLERAIKAVMAEVPDATVDASAPTQTRQFAVGDTVANISLTTLSGKKVALGTSDKPQALMFFAPWCESYLAESRPAMAANCARIRKQVETLVKKSNYAWYGVSSNLWVRRDEVEAYRQETNTELPLAYDGSGELFRAFAVRDIPTIVLMKPDGTVTKIIGPDTQNISAAIK
jgi:thiol-disulfide isomerase/thioredoxin